MMLLAATKAHHKAPARHRHVDHNGVGYLLITAAVLKIQDLKTLDAFTAENAGSDITYLKGI